MANEGYIKLYRRMMKWGWYTDAPTKCVFLHLLFLACYEPCYYKGVHLETGQTVASIQNAMSGPVTEKYSSYRNDQLADTWAQVTLQNIGVDVAETGEQL